MKKYFLLIIILSFLLVGAVQAFDLGTDKVNVVATNYTDYGSKSEIAPIVGRLVAFFLMALGFIFLALTVYAGMLWLNSGGEEEKISKARKILTSGVIGMIIIAGSYSITQFLIPTILEKTTGSKGTVQELPEAEKTTKVSCCYKCGVGVPVGSEACNKYILKNYDECLAKCTPNGAFTCNYKTNVDMGDCQ